MINAEYFLEMRILIIHFQCVCLSSLAFLGIGVYIEEKPMFHPSDNP